MESRDLVRTEKSKKSKSEKRFVVRGSGEGGVVEGGEEGDVAIEGGDVRNTDRVEGSDLEHFSCKNEIGR